MQEEDKNLEEDSGVIKVNGGSVQITPAMKRAGWAVSRVFGVIFILTSLPFVLIGLFVMISAFFTTSETVTTTRGGGYSASSRSDFDAPAEVERFFSISTFIGGLMFTVFGSVPLGMGIWMLAGARKARKDDDADGDGLQGDRRPATAAQIKLIETGFRELGQYYKQPRKRMTQAQAREALRDIKEQLDRRKGK